MSLDDKDEFDDHKADLIERSARYYNISLERMTEIFYESHAEVTLLTQKFFIEKSPNNEEMSNAIDKFYYERYGLKHVRA